MHRPRPTIILNRLIGGWGNQAFQVSAVAGLNDGLFLVRRRQSVSSGFVDSPAYFAGEIANPLLRRRVSIDQHAYREFGGRLPVIVDGMFMNFNYLRNMDSAAYRQLLLSNASSRNPDVPQTPLCMVGFRSFSEEGRHDWRLGLEYYEAALQRLEPGYRFLCFGDDAEFVNWSITRLGISGLSEVVPTEPGQRDIDHIERQIRLAAECHSYIISNSSFHVWCALMSHTNEPEVTYPSRTWLDAIGVPPNWNPIGVQIP